MTKRVDRLASQPVAGTAADSVRTTLPAMTFGQLRMLARAGSPFSVTIRLMAEGYVMEVDVGPRRWVLISTHRKRARRFQRLDGAAKAARRFGAVRVSLELGEDER